MFWAHRGDYVQLVGGSRYPDTQMGKQSREHRFRHQYPNSGAGAVGHARYKRAGSWKYIRVGTLGNGATLRIREEQEPLKEKKKWRSERKKEKQKD